ADGIARVKLGKTDVVAGVKMQPGIPYPDSPNEGSLSVGVELLAMASPDFESGPPRPDSIELSRVVDRGIREGHVIDTEKLCIRSGELSWTVFVDIYVINYDGNLFDACTIASMKAIQNARIPKLENDKIVHGEFEGKLKIMAPNMMTTFYKIGSTIVLDACLSEERAAQARFSISTVDDSTISAMQKGGPGAFTSAEVFSCVETSFAKAKDLRKLL
ncbi:MAG: exosome complex protein Rrp42, partial [Candidatus Diapherotrites archaeon]|nr:exosome complex protein Rrp42 [Candidatus Diapherotrites archaeon]